MPKGTHCWRMDTLTSIMSVCVISWEMRIVVASSVRSM